MLISKVRHRSFANFSGAILCLGALCGPADSADTESVRGKDKVKLTFGWPVTLKGTASYNVTKKVTSSNGSRHQKMAGRYDFRVRPVRDGLAISTENVKVEVEGDRVGSEAQAKLRDFIVRLSSSPPDFVVSHQGAFQRVDGLERFQQQVKSGMREIIADYPPKIRERVERMVAPMISPAQLQQQMAGQWNRDVGFWVGGAELDHNDTYVVRYSNRIPAFGDLALPMATYFKFVDRVPCNQGQRAKRCVKLETRTKIDHEELTKAIENWLASGSGGRAKPNIDGMRVDVNVTLVTDPATLVPHRVREERVTVATVGRIGQAEQIQVTEIDFKY